MQLRNFVREAVSVPSLPERASHPVLLYLLYVGVNTGTDVDSSASSPYRTRGSILAFLNKAGPPRNGQELARRSAHCQKRFPKTQGRLGKTIARTHGTSSLPGMLQEMNSGHRFNRSSVRRPLPAQEHDRSGRS